MIEWENHFTKQKKCLQFKSFVDGELIFNVYSFGNV